MDDFEVSTLIAEGENERIDFKRELDLSLADNKAEFIKDVIALANSAPNGVGYLLIGVDDTKYITGIDDLEEEQIQQIAYTYVSPAAKIHCSLVSMSRSGTLSVGVIEVHRTTRPHKVARSIGRLSQNEVFVRRGSTASKATPEEIIEMHDADWRRREVQDHVSVATTHSKAGNYDAAITAYSKAVEETPSYDLFLARGETYVLALKQHEKSLGGEKFQQLSESERDAYRKKVAILISSALNDFTSAARLADSIEAEKTARLKLFKFGCSIEHYAFYAWEQQEQELQWLRENLTGRDLGEVICLYVETWDLFMQDWQGGEAVVALMDEAMQLGYTEPRALYFHARGQLLAGNCGLAVQEIDKVLVSIPQEDKEQVVELLCYRAEALCKIGRFNEAHETLLRARQIDRDTVYANIFLTRDLDANILYTCGLAYEFSKHEGLYPASMKDVVRLLTFSKGRSKFRRPDGRQLSELDILEGTYPGIVRYLRDIVGEELWLAMQTDRQFVLRF